jgi:autotransporter-associated beta strand protein
MEATESTFVGFDGGTGVLNISGGNYVANGNDTTGGNYGSFRIGDWGVGTGTVNLSSNGVVNASRYTAVGGWGNGTLNISGGTWNQASGGIVVGDFADNSWTGRGDVNQSGGRVNTDYVYMQQGTYNLNGGILAANAVEDISAPGTGVFNFNGGTLLANSNSADFVQADTAEIKAGGAIIDTQTNNVTVSKGLSGAGGLTKKGAGVLTLSGPNNYTGSTTVNAGHLVVSKAALTASIQSNSVAVAFSSTPTNGTYAVLTGPVAAASFASNSVTGLGGKTATMTNSPNLAVIVSGGATNNYATWLNGQPTNSANQIAYAVGGASSPMATNGIPSVTTLTSSNLSITAIVRTNDPNLTVLGQSILNLATGIWITNDVSKSISTNQAGLPANTQRQIFSTPLGSDGKKFLRLNTTLSGQ